MLIRQATMADAEAINDIYNAYPPISTCTFDVDPLPIEARRAWLEAKMGKHFVLVAEQDGQITGWASVSPLKERPAYQNSVESSVYIHTDHHGKGIGKALMLALIEKARANGFHTIIAGATAEQTPSIRLHESLGFEKVAHYKEVGYKFGRWLDTTYYQLML
ncbi:MAG TPA: GNAT family N-acetyltransferase [Fimbriimonas sp.]|nr:GNAT family N-acetyltransferase [Fimbriimonas sp.]